MNILVTGASGFIASQIVTDLLAAQHSITCCVRNTAYTKRLFPNTTVVACDFVNDTNTDIWIERLHNIDVVINCVGILYHYNKKIIWAVHYETPRALFDACVKLGIKKIIQISALGIDKSDVDYAKSKKAADDYLLSLPIQSIILRPSLVYGRGSYGGSSLFRGLAGLPWITPVPGKGEQEFQPIYLQDLSKAVINLLNTSFDKSLLLHAVSAKRITLSEILSTLRSWLGFAKSKLIYIPLWIIRIGSFFGNYIPYSAMNSTAYKMLILNNVSDTDATMTFQKHIGFTPRDFTSGIFHEPSTVQDHWHSRLYCLKPLLQLSIAFIWLFTAACSLFLYPKSHSYELLNQMGVNLFWQPILLYGASIIDALLGIAMLCKFQLKKIVVIQIIFIVIYSALITWKLPHLWLEPFAPIAKNIPLLVATLIFLALESDR